MKKIVKLVIILIAVISVVFYVSKGDPSQPDTVSISQIGVKKGSSSLVYLGNSPQQVSNAFGAPHSISNEYWETYDKYALVYAYMDGAKFEFIDNKLESYDLTGPDYFVGSSSGSFFGVSSALSSVSPYLPNWASQKGNTALSAAITDNNIYTDKFIYIEFHSNEVIHNISIRDY